MRVLHVNTYDIQGGAARSAHRLHTGLVRLGHDSRMLVRHKASSEKRIVAAELEGSESARKQTRHLFSQAVLSNRTPISNTHFSLPEPSWDISAHPEILSAEIVHLHWIADFVALPTLGALLASGVPMVWTLHDQRAMTGGCHFTAGCDRYQSACRPCPQLIRWADAIPAAILADTLVAWGGQRPVIVCPSRWLADCARQSTLLNNARVEVIPYGLDTSVFRPQDPHPARQRFGWKESSVIVLFGADSVHEHRKGFHALQAGLNAAARDDRFRQALKSGRIVLVCFGDRGNEFPPMDLPIQNLGRIHADHELAALYAGVDAVLLPSLEDNLPNVLLEAMCCGTPVLAHRVGGVPDVLEDGRNGLMVPPGDPAAFGAALIRLTLDTPFRQSLAAVCREEVPARFPLESQAGRYADLYAELAGSPRPSPSPTPLPRSSCPLAPWAPAFQAATRAVPPKKPAKRSALGRLLDKFRGAPKTSHPP